MENGNHIIQLTIILLLFVVISLVINAIFLTRILKDVESIMIPPCSESLKQDVDKCYIEED